MKLRYLFTMLAAVLTFAFVGCQKEEGRFLDEVQVSSSYVALPAAGGQKEITVTAKESWSFSDVPEWLTVSPLSGASGETRVTFTAAETANTNEAMIYLNCGSVSQIINVLQMTEKVELPISTCAEVNNGEDGVTYRIKGAVTSIANTTYGNMYIEDETGTVYVYGTLYEGASKQFTKHGIEVGDIVTVEGPRKNYNGTIELVDVTVIAIEKSLIKLDEETPAVVELPLEGGEFKSALTCKGEGLSVVIPEAAKSWLSVTGIATSGSITEITFVAAQNAGGAREADLTFKTVSNGVEYSAVQKVQQAGSIVESTVADFLNAPVGTSLFKLTGRVANLKNTTYGNFDLVDATGSVYVYGLTATQVSSNDKSFSSLGINEGDVVTLIGTRAEYNGTAQVGGPAYYVSHIGHTEATVADFLTKESNNDNWYKLTGKVANLNNTTYGNFDLVDATGSVYVYGLTAAPVAKNDKSFSTLGIKEGDTVTLIGTRAEYNGTAQVGGPAYYISHESAGEEGGEEEGGEVPAGAIIWNMGIENQTWAEDTHETYGAGYAATEDGVKVGYYKNSSQTDPIAPKDDHIRVYQESYLVVKADGKKIKAITIECAGDKIGPIKVGETEYTATDGVITWTGDVDVFEAFAVKQTRVAKLTIVAE